MLLFISDIHLQEERPELTQGFLSYLQTRATQAKELYLLGDIFNYWVGDDAMSPYQHSIAAALRELSLQGTKIFLMHGNRDFAIGQVFCQLAGANLIPDPHVIQPLGAKILLMHGDSLCTEDRGYQVLRYLLRQPLINWCLHRLPLKVRIKIGAQARKTSLKRRRLPAAAIVDVTPVAAVKALQKHTSQLLIHGHTHRPQVHNLEVRLNQQNLPAQRIVLGDWSDTQGWEIQLDATGASLQEFSFTDLKAKA